MICGLHPKIIAALTSTLHSVEQKIIDVYHVYKDFFLLKIIMWPKVNVCVTLLHASKPRVTFVTIIYVRSYKQKPRATFTSLLIIYVLVRLALAGIKIWFFAPVNPFKN